MDMLPVLNAIAVLEVRDGRIKSGQVALDKHVGQAAREEYGKPIEAVVSRPGKASEWC